MQVGTALPEVPAQTNKSQGQQCPQVKAPISAWRICPSNRVSKGPDKSPKCCHQLGGNSFATTLFFPLPCTTAPGLTPKVHCAAIILCIMRLSAQTCSKSGAPCSQLPLHHCTQWWALALPHKNKLARVEGRGDNIQLSKLVRNTSELQMLLSVC